MSSDLRVFSGRSHPELTERICQHLSIKPSDRKVIRFSNQNLMVRIEESVRACDVFVVQTSCPPVHDHLMELLIFIDALKRASAQRVTAVMPYFPYVRSDKKDQPRIAITARLVADLLEAAGADRVLTMDLHAPQIQGFFKIPVDHLHAAPILAEHIRQTVDLEEAIVVAGDAGEAKDAASFARRLDLDIAIIDKRRYANDDQARAEHLIGNVEGRTAILIDDEIASGGTLLQATDFLQKNGAKDVVACATHGVLTKNAPEKLQASQLGEVAITDTLPLPLQKRVPKLRQLSISELVAHAIQNIHTGESVSTLFT